MAPISATLCDICGRPLFSDLAFRGSNPLCHACRRGVYNFDRARSFAAYHQTMRSAVALLKYDGVTALGRWFAARLEEIFLADQPTFQADVVVPVPLHPARFRERGYNQAALIARPLARGLRLPLGPVLLVRTRPRPDKLLLSRRERWETVRGAYATRSGARVDKARVLLIDDVFTTGATLDACSKALKAAGAAAVYSLTVARAMPAWF